MDHTKELIIKAQQGDKEARDKVVCENMGLVYSSARKYMGRGAELEDLIQIGVIGLIKSIDRFDISFDVLFSTYAVVMIVGEIKRFLRDDGMIKVSRSIKENAMKIRYAREELNSKLMREPTVEEISQKTGIPAEDIAVAEESSYDVESIHKTIYQSEGNEIYLLDKLTDNKDESEELLNNMVVKRVLRDLKDNDRKLIVMRYFENKTQTEVAKELGISQVQVSRMEKKILLSMREKIS